MGDIANESTEEVEEVKEELGNSDYVTEQEVHAYFVDNEDGDEDGS